MRYRVSNAGPYRIDVEVLDETHLASSATHARNWILPRVNLHPTFSADDGLKSEFVRLSYVEGDVRVSEGNGGRVELGDNWAKPLIGFPIKAGTTPATGTGRAEIEFESGWTAYLAEKSILEFVQLELSAGDVPQTSCAC